MSSTTVPTELILPKDHKTLLQAVGIVDRKEGVSRLTLIVFYPPFWFFFKTMDSNELCALSKDTSCHCNHFDDSFAIATHLWMKMTCACKVSSVFLKIFNDVDKIEEGLFHGFTLMFHSVDSNTEIQVLAFVHFVNFL